MRALRTVAALLTFVEAAFPIVMHEDKVSVPMRDGVQLSANLFRSADQGPAPVLVVRTPYGKGKGLIRNYEPFLENGYAVLVQDVRGRYDSGGSFHPLTQEQRDGEDTIRWIGRQPWSNGSVAMLGGSYVGIVQWKAAISGPPQLKAIFPVVAGNDEYRDRFYSEGGAMKLGHRMLWLAENLRAPGTPRREFLDYVWHLPLRTIDRAVTGRTVDFWQEALNHPEYDHFWTDRSTRAQLHRIRVPAFIVGGWYDNFVESDLHSYSELSTRSASNRILIGPWAHNMSVPFPGVDFGPSSSAPVRRFQLDWFRYWLRSPHPAPEYRVSPVQIFVMGTNRWRDEREWPLRRTKYTPFYLTSRSGANSLRGDGLLVQEPRADDSDSFTYDPRRPVPTAGGAVCCNPKVFPWGPMDQRSIEDRDDVLVYTTPPLTQDLEATGRIRVALSVSTSATDTDFTAKLVDVFPDGQARNLCDGILRLRYRESLTRQVLATPGKSYDIMIEAGVTSNVFKAGHRIRLEVSSSNFPRFDRNLNTGKTVADETEIRTARQTVHHGRSHASYILLPVIPQESRLARRS